MEEIDIAAIKKKSLSGIVALTSRTFFLQIVAFGATFLLTIFLSPAIFGIYYVVSAIISFLGYFSDIGLAAALIQKKEELSAEDLTTTFTIQQAMVAVVVVVAYIFSGTIAKFYRLDVAGLWLLRALIFSFFLSSLKTIPSVLLERNLEFYKLVIPQIFETVGFYAVALLLAWQGWGIASFTWAVIVRAVLGLVVIYIISPWKISIGFRRHVARRLLTFGIPFQLNSFLALLKDDLFTVFLGKILPFTQVGYIGWAKKWAEVPLRLIMDSVIRVTFPAFSRLQHDREVLGRAIEKTLFGLALSIFPITVGLLFFVEPMVHIIPKYLKWEPALLSFYLFAAASAVSSLSTPLTNALNAVGKIKTTLWLMVMWTSTTWIVTVPLILAIGFNGVALGLLLISSTLILVVFLAKKVAVFSFWKSIAVPFLGVIAQMIFYGALRNMFHTVVWDVTVAGAGVILYSGILILLERRRMAELAGQFSALRIWRR
ncbi:oligosaccharide flippase family protein [Patescibacteria group bacterium]|nr:oligosaccharide flippase family protein [Patescibacteria group bacterium]